jgi:hypothetical protein
MTGKRRLVQKKVSVWLERGMAKNSVSVWVKKGEEKK